MLGNAPSSGARLTRPQSIALYANFGFPAIMHETGKYGAWNQKRVAVFDLATLGVDVLTNGTFTGSATGWTLGTGWAYSANTVVKNADGTGTLTQALTGLTIGSVYVLTYTISAWTVGTITPSMPTAAYTYNNRVANGTYQETFIATATTETLTFTPSNTARFTIDTISLKKVIAGALHIAGVTYTNGGIVSGAPVRLPGYTVATLPAGVQGDTAFVTDALAPTFMSTVTGGGAVVTKVFYNGANWIVG
jgi:hypothetical protein